MLSQQYFIINVQFFVDNLSDFEIVISDYLGQEITREARIGYSGSFQSNYDLSELPSGVYLIQIMSDKSKITKKIIVYE